MSDDFLGNLKIPQWVIYSAFVIYLFSVIFCIIGIFYLISRKYSYSTLIVSSIILGSLYLRATLNVSSSNPIILILGCVDVGIGFTGINLSLILSLPYDGYFGMVISGALKFLAIFGVVESIRKIPFSMI